MTTYKTSIDFSKTVRCKPYGTTRTTKWWFSVIDVVAALNGLDDYRKTRNYWRHLKSRLKKEGNE